MSHRHRFIYTKTGKTGGTSVELYFEPYCVDAPLPRGLHGAANEHVCDAGIVGFRGTRRPADSRWWNHMSAAEIKRHLGDAVWNSYFKFCAIRNPFERLISRFYHVRVEGKIDIDPTLPDYAQFERWLLTRGRGGGDRNRFTIDGNFCLDDVIRFERLQADTERICARLGLPWKADAFPHAKAGLRPAHATVTNMYTEAAEEIVRKQYAVEFELFGYPDHINRSTANERAVLAASA